MTPTAPSPNALRRQVSCSSNEGGVLPLAKGKRRLLVVGSHADVGVLSGGGSTSVRPTGSLRLEGISFGGLNAEKVYHLSSPLRAIEREAGAGEVTFLDGKDVEAAVRAAREAASVILFAEQWRAENLDGCYAAELSAPSTR